MRRLSGVLLGSVLLAALAAGGLNGCSALPSLQPTPSPSAPAPSASGSVVIGSPASVGPRPSASSTKKPKPHKPTKPHKPSTPAKPRTPATPRTATGGSTSTYPWHTDIVSTTFWVGEIFDPNASDGSQVLSTYNSRWMKDYGGCDGKQSGGDCRTERRTAANDWFPTSMTPKENPFYLDLPFDDINDRTGLATRADVIPWAHEARYASILNDRNQSLMKNRWVELRKGSRTCFAQIEDAGPGQYHDAAYVFGHDDARPANQRYGGAGMDVSPAVNGCLGFAELDGDTDRVSWRFVDDEDVPSGPWTKVITRSGVR
ncbi:hypothetical protein [uncultured Amnibacterium sp.]|uniref:hypothetical protein n=1 Tax=uncultured Amnibacterium sp. TaxID=1631851 RepID=UPI0035CA87AC